LQLKNNKSGQGTSTSASVYKNSLCSGIDLGIKHFFVISGVKISSCYSILMGLWHKA